MNIASKLATISVLAIALGSPVFAQSTVTGVSALNDRIDDITTDVNRDLAKGDDAERFGPLGVPQGWRGSLAFSASSVDGNSDTGAIAVGSRMTYGAGKWAHTFGIAGEYARNGAVTSTEEMFVTYEANRYFTEKFYMFGLGRYQYDGVGGTEHEGFIGFGPGLRVVNNDKTTWRVQAGPGALYTKTSAGVSNTDAAGIISSRFYHRFNETFALTNDTDIMMSNNTTIATNDLGLNLKMTEKLSTRFSYRTDYDDSRAIKTDNTLGISLVVGF